MYAIRFLTLDWAFFTQNSCKVPFRIPETLFPPALLEDNLCGFKDKSVCRWAFALISMPWKMYGGVHKKACIKENPLENYTHNWQWISNVNDSRSVETIPQDDQHPSQIWNKSLDGLWKCQLVPIDRVSTPTSSRPYHLSSWQTRRHAKQWENSEELSPGKLAAACSSKLR